MPTPLTRADIITRFNVVVRDPIVAAYPAVWHSANLNPVPAQPTIIRHNQADFGANAEPVFGVGDIPDPVGDHTIIRIFYVLHNLAMRLTRVRMARNFYTNETWTVTEAVSRRAALKAGIDLYFDIPTANLPLQGANVTLATLNAFLAELYTAVEARRTGAAYAHLFVTATCHGNCHGSRGRR